MKRINIYITEDTDRQIDALSELLQVTRSEIIRTSIESYSKNYEESIQAFIENLDYII
jgi:metal-responsive CopG/Arc/MetJ family transcriptional regulator